MSIIYYLYFPPVRPVASAAGGSEGQGKVRGPVASYVPAKTAGRQDIPRDGEAIIILREAGQFAKKK